MTELKIKIEDQYLLAFINFLDTLSYVKVEPYSSSKEVSATEGFLIVSEPDNPLRKVVRPLQKSKTIEAIIEESNYKKTDWRKINILAQELNITESVDELAQLLTA